MSFDKQPLFTIGAFAIIFNQQNQVLLVHRTDYDFWNLPGGRMEYGESPADTVVRETREETGYDVVIDRLSGIYTNNRKNDMVFVFVCHIVGGISTISDESDKIEYFAVDNLPRHFSPKSVERIQDASSNNTDVVFKIQNGLSGREFLEQELL